MSSRASSRSRTRSSRFRGGRESIGSATVSAPGSSYDPLTLTWSRYYDYSDASSVTLNGSTISQINDLSGNNGHALQGTALNQPEYTLAAVNGLNVGTFDADFLETAADLTLARPAQLFFVARFTGAAGGAMADPFSCGTSEFLLRKVATTDVWAIANTTLLSSAVAADNSWHVFCASFNTGSSYLMIDGVEVVAGSSGTGSASSETLKMGAAAAGARPFTGQIALAAIGGLQADVDRDAMVTHLMTTYAI